MKRFVICLDGTWQRLRQDKLTNIGTIARSVAHTARGADGSTIPQFVIYAQGVGSTIGALGDKGGLANAYSSIARVAGGAFGDGIEDQIVDTYLKLAFNYEAGDEIYIFGFSRGAFAARSLAGMISEAGIVSRRYAEEAWQAFDLYRKRVPDDSDTAQKEAHASELKRFRMKFGKGRRDDKGERYQTDDVPQIQYLGLFDTVVRRGVPRIFGGRALSRKFIFHDLKLAANVRSARHAVAIDEDRFGFPPTIWEESEIIQCGRAEQCWFVGAHGDVGGGEGSPLSSFPLKWIADGAEAAGLALYPTEESPLHEALREANADYEARIARPKFFDSLAPINWRTGARRIWIGREPPSDAETEVLLHRSTIARANSKSVRPRYAPAPLKPFRKALKTFRGKDQV